MSFADRFAGDVEEPEPPPEPVFHERPEWLGPPDGELGAVPLARILARSESGVVALSHAVAYSNGVTFELLARVDGLSHVESSRIFHEQHLPQLDPDELPDAFLRVGVELPGGARVSNLGGRPFGSAEDAPARPVLFQQGGGGGMSGPSSVTMKPGYWLWPLPGEGTLRLVVEWPVAGIALAESELDGTAIAAAAANVLRLWDEDEHGGATAGGWVRSSAQYAVASSAESSDTVEVPVAELRALEAKLRRLRRGGGE